MYVFVPTDCLVSNAVWEGLLRCCLARCGRSRSFFALHLWTRHIGTAHQNVADAFALLGRKFVKVAHGIVHDVRRDEGVALRVHRSRFAHCAFRQLRHQFGCKYAPCGIVIQQVLVVFVLIIRRCIFTEVCVDVTVATVRYGVFSKGMAQTQEVRNLVTECTHNFRSDDLPLRAPWEGDLPQHTQGAGSFESRRRGRQREFRMPFRRWHILHSRGCHCYHLLPSTYRHCQSKQRVPSKEARQRYISSYQNERAKLVVVSKTYLLVQATTYYVFNNLVCCLNVNDYTSVAENIESVFASSL